MPNCACAQPREADSDCTCQPPKAHDACPKKKAARRCADRNLNYRNPKLTCTYVALNASSPSGLACGTGSDSTRQYAQGKREAELYRQTRYGACRRTARKTAVYSYCK